MEARSADLLRSAALFLVVLLHVAASSFHTFHESWDISVFYGSLSRVCIPIFFMLSGALLLNREERISEFFKKRASKVIVPTVFWSMAYLFYRKYATGPQESSLDPVQMLQGPVYYHLWFMYAIITLYVATPFLRVFNIHAPTNVKWYAVALWFLAYCTRPWIDSASAASTAFDLGFIPQYGGFMLLGSLLSRYIPRIRVSYSLALYLIGTALTFGLTVWYSRKTGAPNQAFYDYLAPNVVLAASGLYLVLARLGERFPGAWKDSLQSISQCTFGIYFVHVVVMNALLSLVFHQYYGASLKPTHALLNIPLIALASVMVSMAVVGVMKRTPVLRHVV